MHDTSNLQAAFADAAIPGLAAIIVDREGTRLETAMGHADIANDAPMTIDTIGQIASMTKPLVSVAAMQLVERGVLDLDAPVGNHLPELADPQILTGFDESGAPQTRPAMVAITVRHLLTHTAGLGYVFVQDSVMRYFEHAGMPEPGTRAGITMPLLFEPGSDWAYSVATDWLGLLVERATGETLGEYLQAHVTGPLKMNATAFRAEMPAGAAAVHARQPDGEGFVPLPVVLGGGEYQSGGGGLSSTLPDYARFMRMILREGELDGIRVLERDSVHEMSRNQIGSLRAGAMGTTMPELALANDAFPDQHTGWGLGFLINPDDGPHGRKAGSLAWAGIFNSYFWIDPASGIAGAMMAQLSPFADPGAQSCFAALEMTAYG